MRDLEVLYPKFRDKIELLKQECERQGLLLGIGETFRTMAEQDALYAKGRTVPGQIVTNAKGRDYNSQHQWFIAMDFFKNIKGQEYSDLEFFSRVGSIAKSLGLGWGGDWTSPKDRPHIYWKEFGDTPRLLKSRYGTPETFKLTWVENPQPVPVSNQNVSVWQNAMNIGFDLIGDQKLAIDNSYGPASQRFANKNQLHKGIKGCPTAVRWLQRRLTELGYPTEVDGNIGSGCDAQIKQFQANHGLTPDGWVGTETVRQLLK